MFEFTANGPTEMAVLDLMKRFERMGFNIDTNMPIVLSEQEQIRIYQ
jgi:hypothetical protein